jgi:pseudaminic acid biosynthesis-associated methylase
MSIFKTEQENFWAGEFGNQYIERNKQPELFQQNILFFSEILKKTENIKTVMEFGANIGLNLLAIRHNRPNIKISGLEINSQAVEELRKIENIEAYHGSILDFEPDYERDLVLTKVFLIHINPDELQRVYEKIYQATNKYICLVEYYNTTPVTIIYRGHENRLFKRDFAGEMLERYHDLSLLDYGFAYHRDKQYYYFDDLTWFLLEKKTHSGEIK